MPSVACLGTLQRELADCIIRCAPLDDIRILLACGARVDEPVTQGLRPLHYAAFQRYSDALRLLLVRGSDPDAQDEVGYTALHLCAERGYRDLVQVLLQHNARVSFTQEGGGAGKLGNPPRTALADEPLRLAVQNGHYDVAELLLRNGADPNARYFLGSEINLVGPTNARFLDLLLRHGADPDSRDRTGLTPLMRACRHPQGAPAARVLLRHGADPNATTSDRHDRRTVLHYAVLSGNADTVRMLLDKGAAVRFPPDYRRPTPLDFAILGGRPEMVRLLIESGADVNAGSPVIGCPLHIALSERLDNKREIVRLLLECGADPNAVSGGGSSEGGQEEGCVLIRPPLGEYLCAADPPQEDLVRMLLRHGARVVLRYQVHHPYGILKSVIHRLMQHDRAPQPEAALSLVLETAESYAAHSIQRSLLLSDAQRELLLEHALTPLTLKHTARLLVRNLLGKTGFEIIEKVPSLPIPRTLQRYLLYEM